MRSRQKSLQEARLEIVGFFQNPVGVHWRTGISSPLSSVCILGGVWSPPLCRAFCSSCLHKDTQEHSKVLYMPVPAGSLFCASGVSEQVNILLPGTRLSPPPQLFSQAWPFPSAGSPAPTAHQYSKIAVLLQEELSLLDRGSLI